jgi:thymidylate synthase
MLEANSADEAWLLAVNALKSQSTEPRQNSRSGSTCELLHVVLQVRNPRERWVVSRSPALSVAFALVEVIGILAGRRDSLYLNFFNPALPKFAGHGAYYHGAYGFRLRENASFDQLTRAAQALRSNHDTRQVVLQIWDSAQDFPSVNGAPAAPDVPCNVCSMLKIRNERLEWTQIMRSNDLFKGLPYNFVQFTTLQEVIAGWIGVEVGSYTHYCDSLHLYDEDLDFAFGSGHQIASPKNNDSLALPKELSQPIWTEMNRRVNLLVSGRFTEGQLDDLAKITDAPQAFTNLMALVVADAARRHGKFDAALTAASACKNPLLQLLWTRWQKRKAPKQRTEISRTR